MKVWYPYVFLGLLLFGLNSCSSNSSKSGNEDVLVGSLKVVADETILPLIQEQKEVFESSYTNAKVLESGKPEIQAINTLLKGEADVAILTRALNADEKKSFEQRQITPRIFAFAYDGIVLVSNKNDIDTGVVVSDIIELLKGNKVKPYTLVFDNVNSSILRYFRDLGNIEKVANTFVEAKTNAEEVLKTVASSTGKIGFLSLNQYLTFESSFQEMDKIRILSVLNEKLATPKYVKPSQASLSTDEYPLKREIFVLNYQPNLGLGIGFSAFLTGDRGQRIVLKAGMLPVTMPGREIIIRN
ncbi:PstS family phosphate ABC transporter substrate-binding protein [Sphingobacterium sp. Mn56C]|uniref:PstS family phosphate ABC transporter substrate-binding protein n=1 Tax=Sphingobacterium sp. Mn56C TaxID=3395261 RepID=UPI003BBB1ADC